MRQLHWAVVPDKKLKGSMWDGTVDDSHVALDTRELETLFASKPAAAPAAAAAEKPAEKKPDKVALLDAKRATSIATALQSFKMTLDLSQGALCNAVRDGDLEAFRSSRMEMYTVMTMISTVMPSAEEAEMVESHDGPRDGLRDLEQFVLQVSEKVPKAVLRARCLSIRSTFLSSVDEHMAVLEAVHEAATQVRHSKALRGILEYTLALGNYLNGTSNKGGAWGFKLEALAKLANTKTLDNQRTLLHYMAEKLASQGVVRKLREEMPALAGLRFEWKSEAAEVRGLASSLNVVKNAAEHDSVDAFVRTTSAFVSSAEGKLKALEDELGAAGAACKELGAFLVEDSLAAEPEAFFGMLHGFILSFEKAERFNHEVKLLEAQKKKREEAAAKRDAERRARGASVTAAAGSGPASHKEDAAFKAELNKALLQKVGIKNERKNLIDSVERDMTNAAHARPRRHAPAPK